MATGIPTPSGKGQSGIAELAWIKRRASAPSHHHPIAHLVKDDREDQQDAQEHHLHVGADLRKVHPVLDQHDEKAAQNHVLDPANPAAQGHPGNDAGGDGFKRNCAAKVGLSAFDTRGQQQPGE